MPTPLPRCQISTHYHERTELWLVYVTPPKKVKQDPFCACGFKDQVAADETREGMQKAANDYSDHGVHWFDTRELIVHIAQQQARRFGWHEPVVVTPAEAALPSFTDGPAA
jgi:hypothetical protein